LKDKGLLSVEADGKLFSFGDGFLGLLGFQGFSRVSIVAMAYYVILGFSSPLFLS
jgi:hypothetical protein